MCIRVKQDDELQARRRARDFRPAPAVRHGRAQLIEGIVGMAGAKAAVLLSEDGEPPLVRGDVPAIAALQRVVSGSLPTPGVGADTDAVERLCSAGARQWAPLAQLARTPGLCGQVVLLMLREPPHPPAWLFLFGGPVPRGARRAALQAAGLALLGHTRLEQQARAAALHAKRLEDVAY